MYELCKDSAKKRRNISVLQLNCHNYTAAYFKHDGRRYLRFSALNNKTSNDGAAI